MAILRPILLILVFLTSFHFAVEGQPTRLLPAGTDSLMSVELLDAKSKYIAGLREFELENYENALELLTSSYIKLPDNSGVNFALADTYLELNELNNAAYYAKQAISLEPENPWYHLKLSDIYVEDGKIELAVASQKQAIKLNPNDMDMQADLANLYESIGNLNMANNVYADMLKKRPKNVQIRLRRYTNFRSMNKIDSAVTELEDIRAVDPQNISTLQKLGSLYLKLDALQKAKETLDQAYRLNEKDGKTALMLADIHLQLSEWGKAGAIINTVITDEQIDNRDKLNIVEYLVTTFEQQMQDSTLKAVTRQAVDSLSRAEAESGKVHLISSQYYLAIEENMKALESLKRTLDIAPYNDVAWRRRVQLLFNNGDYKKVAEIGREADQYVPDDPFILYFVGASHYLLEQPEQAIDWLQRAGNVPARRPFKSSVYAMLGDVYASENDWDKSDNAYETALSMNSDNHNALNNYAYYLSERDEELEKALEMVKRALQLEKENASYLDTAGWVYYKMGNYEEAKKYLRRAIETGDASAEVYEHYGDVFEKLNQPDKAVKWWQKALDLDPSRKALEKKISSES